MAETTGTPTPETPDFDYSTLVTPDTPPAAVKPEAKEPEAEAPTEAQAPDETGTEATGEVTTEEKPEAEAAPKEEAPASGTPDKRQQRIDQLLTTVERLVKATEAKGDSATPADKAKLEKEKDKLLELLEEGGDKEGNDTTKAVVKRLIESDNKTNATADELAELRAEIQELKAERTWANESKKYEGVEVRDVWKKAVDDATSAVETKLARTRSKFTPEQIEELVYAETLDLYSKRCDEAAKSIKAKSANPQQATPPRTARGAPPKPTPGSARVMSPQRGPSQAPADPLEITDADYAALIKQE